jgi:signal transduction histidine kinase
MNNNFSLAQKWTLLVLLVAGITFLHYNADQGRYYFHVFYGELYFLPIVLAAFWFGLHGALLTSVTISASYLPFIFLHWQSFSPNDLDEILTLLLYNGLAVLAGVLRDRETAARERLLQAENLAVMGRSLAAAAHDMKMPLMLIGGFARSILKKMGDKNPARTKLAIIIKETEKMEGMTRDMLDFSKPLTLNLIRANFDTIVQASLTKLKEAARRHNVAIEYRSHHPDVVAISGDTLRLEQVIVNLVLNAIEASPKGGTVLVTLTPSPAGDMVLDVTDKGCGIPSAKRQEVFNPFFTTKKEGTGLGLPIVKKIVEAHGWSLQILDNDGGGTVFRVNLITRQ